MACGWSVGANVSTVAVMAPSRNTCAIPPQSPLNPIQLTPVPLKARVAVGGAACEGRGGTPVGCGVGGKKHVRVGGREGQGVQTAVSLGRAAVCEGELSADVVYR